jgi:hypothetical protein
MQPSPKAEFVKTSPDMAAVLQLVFCLKGSSHVYHYRSSRLSD